MRIQLILPAELAS